MAFLPYGTNDSALVFRHNLTTAVTSSDISGKWTTLLLGANGQPDHDPVLGMIAKNNTGNTGYRFSVYTGPSLVTNGFQLSIEVQASWITADGSGETPPNGSDGYVPAISEVLLSALSKYTDLSTPAQFLVRKNPTGTCVPAWDGAQVDDNFIDFLATGASVGSPKFNSWGRGDWVTVNFGVVGNLQTGGYVVFGIDGYPMCYCAITKATYGNPLENFYIGCDRFSDEYVNQHYFRNLQIVARGPDIGKSNGVKIAFLSDSLSDATTPWSHASAYDNTMRYALQRYTFVNTGRYIESISIDENGGYGIGSYMGASNLSTRVATVLSGSPNHVVICAGTNDLGNASYSGSDFESSYKTMIETFAGTSVKTSVRKIGLCIPPPRFSCVSNSTHAANHSDVSSRIRSIPAWFKATHPDSAVEIVIIDNFAMMGGNHALAEHAVYPQNTMDDVHFSSEWNRLYGLNVYNTMIKTSSNRSSLIPPLIGSIVS